MRNLIMGSIGVLLGLPVVYFTLTGGLSDDPKPGRAGDRAPAQQGDGGAFKIGQIVGTVFGFLLLGVGGYYVYRGIVDIQVERGEVDDLYGHPRRKRRRLRPDAERPPVARLAPSQATPVRHEPPIARPVDEDEDEDEDEECFSARGMRSGRYMEPHRGQLILILGILSIFVATPILGPMAWIMGRIDLAKMRSGRMDPKGKSETNVGRLCGMIATLVLGGIVVITVLFFGVVLLVGAVKTKSYEQPYVAPAPKARERPASPPEPVPPAAASKPGAPADRLTDKTKPATPASPPRLTGLIAHWSFDEDDGDVVKDKSGNGLHARLVGCKRGEGVRGKGVEMTGKDEYVDLGTSQLLNFGDKAPFTISLWYRTRERDGTLLSFRKENAPAAVIDVTFNVFGVEATLRGDGGEFGEVRVRARGPSIRARGATGGQWHHLAVTRNEQGEIAVFLDGADGDSQVGGNSAGPITTDLRALGSERLWKQRSPAGNPDFIGSIDEVQIHGRVLTDEELKGLANELPGERKEGEKRAGPAAAKPGEPLAPQPPGPAANVPDGLQELKTADGRARVLAPKGQHTRSSSATATVNGVQMQVHITIAGGNDSAFGVAVVELPKDGRIRDPQQQLNLARDGILQRTGGRLTSEKRIVFGQKKHPGRELIGDVVLEGVAGKFHCRLYCIDGFNVCLLAVMSPTVDLSKEVERFYKSFEWNSDGDKAKGQDANASVPKKPGP